MTQAVIDLNVLGELEETVGPEFVEELVATFLEEGPGMIAELRMAAEAGDAEALRRAAHSMKSNAITFGAVALAELARRIELQGLGEKPRTALEEVEGAFEAAARALNGR